MRNEERSESFQGLGFCRDAEPLREAERFEFEAKV